MLVLDEMVGLLKAAGELTRLRLLALLAQGDLSVKDLTSLLNQSQPRISRHLKLLFEAGLVERLPEGAWVYYRLTQDEVGRNLLDAMLAQIDGGDSLIKRDQEKLVAIKQANAKAASDYFQQNAERWDELRALHVPESAVDAVIRESLGSRVNRSLLDLGTGTGSMLTLLGDICDQGLGLDANRSMLSIARARLDDAAQPHLHVQHGDILDLATLDGEHDLITLHQVLHYLDDPSEALEQAIQVLSEDGRLLIVDFAPHAHEFLRKDHAHRRLGFSHEAMAQWLSKVGMRLVSVRDLEQDHHDGEMSETPLTVSVWLAERAR